MKQYTDAQIKEKISFYENRFSEEKKQAEMLHQTHHIVVRRKNDTAKRVRYWKRKAVQTPIVNNESDAQLIKAFYKAADLLESGKITNQDALHIILNASK